MDIPIKRVEIIGNCVLYLGDCREILPLIGKVDACVMDPPYGIGVDTAMARASGTQFGKAAAPKGNYIASGWDNNTPDKVVIDLAISLATHTVIFGGNYFDLPPSRCWLVWNKENGGNAFADCELAWTNLDKPVRKIDWMWNGMLRKGGEERNGHPTQKPQEVMKFCIEQLPKESETILDPFMGSGTTGVACVKLGRKFIGIELDETYFNIACERIRKAYAQPDMFIAAPAPKAVQEVML